MKNKKFYKGAAGKKFLAVFLVIFSLFCVVAVGGGIARFYFGDDTLTISSLVKRILNQGSLIQQKETKKELLKSSNEKSNVELGYGDKSLKLALAPVDKSKWPKDAVGGLFQLEPSGEFKEGVTFKMALKEAAPADFALGYWHPDNKKWEWLPTAKLDEKTFQTVLPHATEIGGASGGACSSMPKDPENVQMYNEIKAGMSKIQIGQQTGKAAKINDASWKPVWENAKEMTDKAINDYCKKRNLTNEYDFYATWELIQCLGFQSLNDRFENAWRNKCEEPQKSKQYKIDQSDDYKANFHLNLGWFYQQNSKFNSTIHYVGNPQGVASKGKPAWRTYWKVHASTEGTGNINQTGHLEDKDFYYDLSALNTASNTTDSYEATFSLDNVKEGESFEIRQVRSGTYISRMSGPDATLKLKTSSFNYNGSGSMQDTQTIAPGKAFTYSAVLLKDMGDDGAIIAFSNEPQLTPEQKKQFEEVIKMQKASGLPIISDMWTAPGKLNSKIMDTEGEAKPWRIVPVGTSDDSNSKKTNPNDKDGDGVPDLVPLPSAGDKNADGIPDSQQ